MFTALLLPADLPLTIDRVEENHNLIRIHAHFPNVTSTCPDCQHPSTFVHSHYIRRFADLPILSIPVQWYTRVRRFFCSNPACPRQTFVECLPSLAGRQARRTLRNRAALETYAFALGGEAGHRVSCAAGLPVSSDTLLRLIHATPVPPCPPPTSVGVDDFAWKKGQRYGTIITDLTRHCPIDVLPDRLADSLAIWLTHHPSITVISRDRAKCYADGATRGAPEALQVADRWHLLSNLTDHLFHLFERKHHCLREPPPSPEPPVPVIPADPVPVSDAELAQSPPLAPAPQLNRKETRYHAIHRLHADGYTMRAIARMLPASRQTVQKYLRAETVPRYAPRAPRLGKIAPYTAYLSQRWSEGCTNGTRLFKEIEKRGYQGSAATLRLYLRSHASRHPAPPRPGRGSQRIPRPAPVPRQLLSARQAAWLLGMEDTKCDERQRTILAHLRASDPQIEFAYQRSQEFRQMVRERQPQNLESWLTAIETANHPELLSFALGIRQDYMAVKAGLSTEFNNGQSEGQVNRLKTVKRAMYGRAGFALLRARVLHRESKFAASP